jgi:hypothetical protein
MMMMLDSLKQYDSDTANNILAAIALSSTTNPGVGEAAESIGAYEQERVAVLQELRSRLNVSPSDDPAEINRRVLALLSRQIHEISLEGKDADAVLARAGQAGRLTPSLYRVEFVPTFAICVGLGTKIAHVHDAILRSDEVQHLEGAQGEPGFSLFLKFHVNAISSDSFWLLVLAHRNGRTLIVQNAWRVYPSDVDLTDAKRPIDVLRAFANVFGLQVQVGIQAGKFILNEIIPLRVGQVIRAYTIKGLRNKAYVGTMSGHDLPEAHRVIVAYAIDLLAYEKSLHHHKVRTNAKYALSPQDEYSISVSRLSGSRVNYTFT